MYLVNSWHLRHVLGRKSDVLDCQWIQQLHSLGLLRSSFRPDAEMCALRSLLRHRAMLIEHRSPHILHIQKALLHGRLNERGEALKALEAALALGEPRGLVRAIADAGPQLEPLLRAVARRIPSSYLDRILAALQPLVASTLSSQSITPAPAVPMVSLTYREQDVLVLLGRRYTDREIAEALVISPLTVRYHIENLSEKLGIRGRRVVVARARELGLLTQS